MTDMLSVIQADHDAVQAFHRTMADRLMADINSPGRPKLGEDEGDAGTLVQAFARHRLASASAPAGWRMVPVEPTEEMLVAAQEEWMCVRAAEDRGAVIWSAMLTAAPQPPVVGDAQAIWASVRSFVMPNGRPLSQHFNKGEDQLAFCQAIFAALATQPADERMREAGDATKAIRRISYFMGEQTERENIAAWLRSVGDSKPHGTDWRTYYQIADIIDAGTHEIAALKEPRDDR